MTIPLNSSGLPKGTGSLQVRGRVWWGIFTDEFGDKIQMNTHTPDFDRARRILACHAIRVLKARLAALRAVRDEKAAAGSGSDHPAAGQAGPRAHGKKPARAARVGGNDPRQKSPRKGEAA